MKNKIILIAMLVICGNFSYAQYPTGFTNIDINNIDAGISSTNDLFWDFANPKFEVPKGSGKHSIFAGGLWIGGLDNSGNIHLAAQTYRQTGNDFYPGPIDSALGAASNWTLWDQSWKLNAGEIMDHIQNYTMPNYVVPNNIAEWPGYNTSLGRVLAPFADYNSNGTYDPENGDYPIILGDQTVYSIYNDAAIHTETNCSPLNVEIHRTFFGFDDVANTALNNSIFSRYEIKNFSSMDYHDFYVTIWIDFDLGNATDDYVGTDMNLEMMYCFNGDPDDETSAGYGINPPAMGVYFLNDTLSGTIAYNNVNNNPIGNPDSCNNFMSYLQSMWLDNQPVTYGADGRNPGNPPTYFMYPGDTDPVNFPLYGEWSELSAGNIPEDRRMIATIGPFDLDAGEYKTVDIGYTWARALSGGPAASVLELQNAVNSMRLLYDNGTLTAVKNISPGKETEFAIYPNPATDHFNISSSKNNNIYTVTVTDAVGRIMYNKVHNAISNEAIKTSGYSAGLYLVNISCNNQSYNYKLMVK